MQSAFLVQKRCQGEQSSLGFASNYWLLKQKVLGIFWRLNFPPCNTEAKSFRVFPGEFWISCFRHNTTEEGILSDFLANTKLCRCVHPQTWKVGRTLGFARIPYNKEGFGIVIHTSITRFARIPAFGPLSKFGGGRIYIVVKIDYQNNRF